MNMPIIHTNRLTLRPLSPDDAPAVFEWTSDARVTRYLPYTRHTRLTDTTDWLSILSDEADAWYAGVVRKDDGKLIGSISLTWQESQKAWEFGYNYRFDCWGNGYATEALRALLRFAVDSLHAETIIAKHAVDNPASGRVMLKCGMRFDHYGDYTSLDGLRTFHAKFYKSAVAELLL